MSDITKKVKETFLGITPKNWKQENAIQVGEENIYLRENFNSKKLKDKKEINQQIIAEMKNIAETDYCGWHSFYLKPTELLSIGNVYNYKNCKLQYIDLHDGHLVFHFRFDVENLHHVRISELEIEEEKQKINYVEEEWKEIYEEKRKLDIFIPNFDYCYIYDLPLNVLESILEIVKDSERLKFADGYKALHKLHRTMVHKIPTMSYTEKIEYWKIYDIINDVINANVPKQEEIELRKIRYSKSEKEYNEENEKMKILMDDLFKKKLV